MHIIVPALLTLLPSVSVWARLVNYTIDDTSGDERTGRTPQYTSVHLWNARSAGDQCTSCGARPDGTQAFDETWHDETTFPDQLPSNVSFTFNGTVLYIFCILANNIAIVHKDTRLAFYLDGSSTPIDQFLHEPDTAVDGFIYNQLVYKNDALSDGEHTMLVSNWADGDSGSLVLFDYAIYSTEEADPISPQSTGPDADPSASKTPHSGDPTPSSQTEDEDRSSGVNIGAVVGGSVGGALVAVALLALAFWCYCRRRRSSFDTSAPESITSRGPDARAGIVDPFEAYMQESQSAWNSPAHEKGSSARALHDPGHASHTVSPSVAASSTLLQSQPTLPSTDRRDSESAQFRGELDRIRQELERVRQLAEPPEYPHGGRTDAVI